MMLKGRTALVTGAGKGIGRVIALELAKNGANVAISYLTSDNEAKEVVKEMEHFGGKAVAIKTDVRNSNEVEMMIQQTNKKFGKIDILVNNAAFMKPSEFTNISEADFDLIFDTNVKGVFNCIQEVLPLMKKQKSGKIINIASVAGVAGSVANSVYGSSKAAVINLTKALSREFGRDNIKINSVSPGPINTDMLKDVDDSIIKRVISETPLGKLASPEDIAKAVLFLASSDSDFITGQNIIVDGGRI